VYDRRLAVDEVTLVLGIQDGGLDVDAGERTDPG